MIDYESRINGKFVSIIRVNNQMIYGGGINIYNVRALGFDGLGEPYCFQFTVPHNREDGEKELEVIVSKEVSKRLKQRARRKKK